jgi:hypothetical protein
MSLRKGQSPKPYREPLDAVVGLIAGILWGVASAVGVGIYLIPDSPVLVGAGVLLCSIVFGVLGYFKGDDFYRWVRDHWFF